MKLPMLNTEHEAEEEEEEDEKTVFPFFQRNTHVYTQEKLPWEQIN